MSKHMPTRRVMINLSIEDIKLMNYLIEKLGETKDQVVKRALVVLSHQQSQNNQNKEHRL